jgi:selenocysteine lyase/cysteine desulfurase
MIFPQSNIKSLLRRLGVLILALCFACVTPVISAQGKPAKTEMQQPNIDGLVEVSFKIDASGKIQIVHINSTSPQLTEYVVNKLSKIKLSNETAPDGKVITYRFVFKKQA